VELVPKDAARGTTVDNPLDEDATSMELDAGQGDAFHDPGGVDISRLLLTDDVDYELVDCTDRAGDVFTIVRGIGGTQQDWPAGTKVAEVYTFAGMTELLRFSGCYAYDFSEALTLADDTNTALAFDSELYDTDGYHSGAFPTRLIAPQDGYYSLKGGFGSSSPSAAFTMAVGFRKNGTGQVFARNGNRGGATPTGSIWTSSAMTMQLDKDEYAEVIAYKFQGSGTWSLDTNVFGSIERVGR
jgi:hypothetical protein